MSGMTRSSSIRLICSPRGPCTRSSAGCPPGAVTTFIPARLIAASSSLRCTGSSSTIRIVCAIAWSAFWFWHKSRARPVKARLRNRAQFRANSGHGTCAHPLTSNKSVQRASLISATLRRMSQKDREDGLGRRLTRFARVSAGLSGVAMRGAGRALAGGRTLSAANAADLTQVLGTLRGPVMKVAQFVATVPGVLPPEVAAPLLSLQTNAPPMGAGFVRRRMAAELGPDWEKKFKSFEREAAAAASLGQVHRADGEERRGARLQAAISRHGRGGGFRYPPVQGGAQAAARLRRHHRHAARSATRSPPAWPRNSIMCARRPICASMRRCWPTAPTLPCRIRSTALSTGRLLTMSWLEGKPILDFEKAPLKTRNHNRDGPVQGVVAAFRALSA